MGLSRTHAVRALCAACVVFFGAACARDEKPSSAAPVVRFIEQPGSPSFGYVIVFPVARDVRAALAAGKPEAAEWQRILAVRVGDTTSLPMLGDYSFLGDSLRFRPRFPPAPGNTYFARFDESALHARIGRPLPVDSGGGRVATATWTLLPVSGPSTTVVSALYPTSADLPMNLLKMYVQFSAPMSTGTSYRYIRLFAGDSLLEEPFFTAAGSVELWDPEKTRLTILFDPGRIKGDLKPHQERGLPLRQGMRYRLVIDSAWRDARGRPLLRGHEKRFRVRGMDRTIVRTADWTLTAPKAGTLDSLVVLFPEPLDRALLGRLLVVRDSSGAAVPGDMAIGARETRWSFAPRDTWAARPHYVEVDTELEDLAGNNLKKLFDVAPGDSAAIGVGGTRARLWFTPRR